MYYGPFQPPSLLWLACCSMLACLYQDWATERRPSLYSLFRYHFLGPKKTRTLLHRLNFALTFYLLALTAITPFGVNKDISQPSRSLLVSPSLEMERCHNFGKFECPVLNCRGGTQPVVSPYDGCVEEPIERIHPDTPRGCNAGGYGCGASTCALHA